MRELDVFTRAEMVRMFDKSRGNAALVAEKFGVDVSQVRDVVILETLRLVADTPRDPAPARRLQIVPKLKEAA